MAQEVKRRATELALPNIDDQAMLFQALKQLLQVGSVLDTVAFLLATKMSSTYTIMP